MRAWRLIAVPLMALALSCDYMHGPLNPESEIVEFEPPASFKQHWDKVAQCIGFEWIRDARFEDITFYRVGDSLIFACKENEEGCYGLFVRDGVRIFLSGGKLDEEDWFVIEHEFAHAMLMDKDHRLPQWEKCGLLTRGEVETRLYLTRSQLGIK